MTPFVQALMDLLQRVLEENAQLRETVAVLRDEIAVLKGHKPRPKFKSSNLVEETDKGRTPDSENEPAASGDADTPTTKRPGSAKRTITPELEIHETRTIEPLEPLPEGSRFRCYRSYVVRGITVQEHNILVRRAVYETPDGLFVVGPMPAEFVGSHFSPDTRAFVLYLHHRCLVPQPLIRELLTAWGVEVSSGQINALLSHDIETFEPEREKLLAAGLASSPVVTVDDTSAPHKGKAGFATNISSPLFAWFGSTGSKSRLNFLTILHGATPVYTINDAAILYMAEHDLAPTHIAALRRSPKCEGVTAEVLQEVLKQAGITGERAKTIATEGALWGGLQPKVHADLAIVSDGASQFDIGSRHGRCWVHAERLVHKLIPVTDENRVDQARVRQGIWELFSDLKDYKVAPTPEQAAILEAKFDALFTQKTSFIALNEQLKRLYALKAGLLLVLKRPEVPLHTNQSETDIRDYVRRRKISGGTRSDLGQTCRDTFASLSKTCTKLGTSFKDYVTAHVSGSPKAQSLADLITAKAALPG